MFRIERRVEVRVVLVDVAKVVFYAGVAVSLVLRSL